ncbi:MAG: recombinase family protein [Flavobacterium sp.]|uniref:recombinase family protein n=1 Tax=Flavobacterium sp. TaxID=239 RepID=UPI0011F44BF8|nr:recombinase family protein [Flavobacterium sp.]RZJ67678.1 MAG: recombinase family protein [Flavobacterium sp.]
MEKKFKARYIRTSSQSQNNARQLAKQHPDEQLFIDVISGTIPFEKRPAAKKLLHHIALKEVEQVSVIAVDRLGRSTVDVLSTIDHFKNHNVNLHVDNLGLDSMMPNGKPNQIFELMVSVMASLSSLERATLRERQLEGVAAAKLRGTYKGRALGSKESDEDVIEKYPRVVKLLKVGNMTNNLIAETTNVSPHTVKKVKDILNKKAS